MVRALSIDLREPVIAGVEQGVSRRAAAERFGVAPSTAIRWLQSWRETGRPDPKPQGGDRHSHRIESHADELLALVEDTPDITLSELAAYLREHHGLRVAPSTVWRCLDRHGLTFKKTAHASEQQRPDVLARALACLRSIKHLTSLFTKPGTGQSPPFVILRHARASRARL